MPHPVKFMIFLALSFADLALTWLLLRRDSGDVYERNPVAHWWLASYGWTGLIAFKGGAVALVLGLNSVICHYRPRLGGRVLAFGCLAVAAVVLYSTALAGRQLMLPKQETPLLGGAETAGVFLCRPSVEFGRLREQLGQDLVAHRCTLREAVEALAATNTGRNPIFQHTLARLHSDRPYAENLAGSLLKVAILVAPGDPAEVRRVAKELLAEYRATYATAAPWSVEQLVELMSPP